MIGLLSLLRLVPWQAWAVLSVAASLVLGYWHIDLSAYQRGKEDERATARIEAGKRIVEMEKSNEAFRNLSDIERCRAFMRDSGLPIHHCDER